MDINPFLSHAYNLKNLQKTRTFQASSEMRYMYFKSHQLCCAHAFREQRLIRKFQSRSARKLLKRINVDISREVNVSMYSICIYTLALKGSVYRAGKSLLCEISAPPLRSAHCIQELTYTRTCIHPPVVDASEPFPSKVHTNGICSTDRAWPERPAEAHYNLLARPARACSRLHTSRCTGLSWPISVLFARRR